MPDTGVVGSEAVAGAAADQQLRGTLPGRLILTARARGDRTALLQKDRGIYVRYTWTDYRNAVAAAALAWEDLGIRPGDVVAILSDNRVEWVIADLAVQAVGGVGVGVYPTNSVPEVEYVLRHAGARFVVVEDQEQLDKVLAACSALPDLDRIIVVDPRGTRGYDAELIAWHDFLDRGSCLRAGRPEHLEEVVSRIDEDAPAVLIYTSGTTSHPKAAIWSHRVMACQADRIVDAYGMTADDTHLSYLPLCHGAEKLFTEMVALTVGTRVHFGESLATVQADLVEVGPTLFVGMPRIWEKIRANVERDLRKAPWLKRQVFAWAFARGQDIVERQATATATWRTRWIRRIADALVLRALREHVGLNRAWFVMSGGAPIGQDLLAWLRAIGVPVIESFGLTEAGVTNAAPLGSPPRIGSVGPPLGDVECALAEDQEILLRSGTNFLGYLDDEDATRETLSEDGWIHSGDLGAFDDDGWLRIIGRKKDIIITAGGKNLSPSSIENAMKSSSFIAHAVPIGDGRPYVSALLQIDWDTVADWAAQERIGHTSFEDLSSKPEVHGLIAAEVEKANEQLARVSQVRRFRLLPKQLHQDDGELTATQKVRRRFVLEKYSGLVDELYAEGPR